MVGWAWFLCARGCVREAFPRGEWGVYGWVGSGVLAGSGFLSVELLRCLVGNLDFRLVLLGGV